MWRYLEALQHRQARRHVVLLLGMVRAQWTLVWRRELLQVLL